MRVLTLSNLYPPDFIGGYELACSQAVDGLLARGHDVRVMCGAPRTPVAQKSHVLRRFRLPDVYNHYVMNNVSALTRDIWSAEARYVCAHNIHALTSVLDEFQPDVIYLGNIFGLGGLGIMAALDYMRYPWIWQLGDDVPLWLCEFDQKVNPALSFSLQRIQGEFIAVSSRVANRINRSGFQLPGPVHFVPNWIIGDRPKPRKRFYRPGDRLQLITAGQICEHKGIGILIDAIALLTDWGYHNISADLYGHATDNHWQAKIHADGLEGRVNLRGQRPQAELLKAYADYDVFAFPTHAHEPFGLTPLEALAQECVPILARDCGVSEWLVHGVHCLKADRSVESFANTLRSILDGEVDLESIARRGTAAAWRDFHLESYLDKLEVMFDRAACKSRTGAGNSTDVYRLALLGEKLAHLMIHEAHVA